MIEIYLDPCTVNSRKVLAGLDLIGAEYHFNHVDYFTGAHKNDEYKKINPHATIPAATDGDLKITESNAILQYAADINESPYYPKDLKKRAEVNRWLLWEASVWFPSCYVYLVEYVVKPLLKAEPDQGIIDAHAPKWHQQADILDDVLAKQKWLCGEELTIADIAVAAPMHLHKAQCLPLDSHPNLKHWLIAGVEMLPSWQKTQAAVEKALLPGGKMKEEQVAVPSTTRNTTVKTIINYTKDIKDKPCELYFYENEASKHVHDPGDDPREIAVADGWHRANTFSADKEGFSLHSFETSFDTWEDEVTTKSTFYPQVVEFLKRATGAKRVLVFDHTIRTKANDQKKVTQETNTSQRAPVKIVHCDYTAESGPLRVRQLLGDEAEDLLTRRVAFFNVWKPIHNIVEEKPLAVCDVTSSPPEDFHKLYLRYRDRNGENYVMRYSPTHKWWYFPKMNTSQVILLKTFESEKDGRARFVAHTAFDDPTSPANAATRESVEIRTMAFF